MTLIRPEDAFDFVVQFEGMDQPSAVPPEESGVTLGHGYDLRFHAVHELRRDWGPHLAADVLDRLALACGAGHARALELAKTYRAIKITKAMADAVLLCVTLPRWIRDAARIYPGLDALPAPAQVALVSLVFNRGTAMVGPRRTEMRDLQDCVRRGDLHGIAGLLRAMKRLWPNVLGLVRRREAEALLVDGCLPAPEAPQ